MKLTVKTFRIFFFNEFSSKKFFNSLKLTIKNFRNFFAMSIAKKFRKFLIVNFRLLKNFFTAEFIEKKIRKVFTVNFIEKKKSKMFYSQFYWKKFRKFLVVIFRLLKNFLQSISLKKNFENFSENPKKNFLPKKKRVTGGGNVPFFPVKSDTTFHWVLTVWKKIILFEKFFFTLWNIRFLEKKKKRRKKALQSD